MQVGTQQIETSGKLHGKPAIVIHGRRDALVFPNLHSRAYYGLNQEREGKKSRLSYIEVTTGQHFDAFISSFFLAPRACSSRRCTTTSCWRWTACTRTSLTGAALPPSQVVRPMPRGAAPYTPANVPVLLPPPSNSPAAGDRILFERRRADHSE